MKAIAFILVVLTLSGCKKNTDAPGYYFSFDVGGTNYYFKAAAAKMINSLHGFSITDSTSIDPKIFIQCGNYGYINNVLVGEYVDTSYSGRFLMEFVIVGFINTDLNLGIHGLHHDGNFKFLVTGQTDSYLEGTFHGFLGSSSKVEIDNGKFRIPLLQ